MSDRISSSPILLDSKSGFYYREGTAHLKTVKQPPKDYAAMEPGPDDRILDLGAHVGGFMVWAHGLGCRNIWSLEPSPDTFEVLRLNRSLLVDGDIRIFNAAVVPNDAPDTVELWLTKNHTTTGSSCASTNRYRGRESVSVPAMRFRDVLEELMPTAIKVDIEGAEFGLDFSDLPACTTRVALELHYVNRGKNDNKRNALAIMKVLEDQGFAEILPPSGVSCRERRSFNWNPVLAR